MTRPIHASIDVNALQHNLLQVRKLTPGSKVMAVLKADAYGHGLQICGEALKESDAFGLLNMADAVSLRQAGFTQPICLLEGFFSEIEIPVMVKNKLEPVVHSGWQLDILESVDPSFELDVWLKVDTGMHRLGFTQDQFDSALKRLSAIQCVRNISLMSHLANADTPTDTVTSVQLKKFLSVAEGSTDYTRSMANSAAILAHPDCNLDWVRPGIMLYGSSPLKDATASDLNLKPVMSLKSEIISIKNCQKNDAVGYGGSWVCPENMRIGVAACGYGDGYPRQAPTGTPVMVNGKQTQLIGRVSMDMITVDLREHDDVSVGSSVELWGSNVSVDNVASLVGTISYELLCGVTNRVERRAIDNG